MNSALNVTTHHLFAIYSGGKLNLAGGGYQPNTIHDGQGNGVGKYMCNQISYSNSMPTGLDQV